MIVGVALDVEGRPICCEMWPGDTTDIKSLVGKKGFRRIWQTEGRGHFAIDEKQVREDAKYVGIFVLRTDTDHDAETVAHVYKTLWMVEDSIRGAKSILDTRPIHHKCDETIPGHLFCSFLALCLKRGLELRLEAKGFVAEWAEIIRGLDSLQQVELLLQGSRVLLRSPAQPDERRCLAGSAGRRGGCSARAAGNSLIDRSAKDWQM
jgi:hypothetical protein